MQINKIYNMSITRTNVYLLGDLVCIVYVLWNMFYWERKMASVTNDVYLAKWISMRDERERFRPIFVIRNR